MAGSSLPGARAAAVPDGRSSTLAGILIGIGVMAAVDQIIFHQLLAWHHFYDRSTPTVGLLSDGLLHSAEVLALVGGLFWFADLRRRAASATSYVWGGLLLGAGGFQLFDGLVDHKVLRLHQIRYGVHLVPYDVVWNVAAALLLVAGALLLWRARSRPPADRPR
ncbi:DUF2243 domain-containing protein [Micromonospora sp. CPCC 205539]|uniref:DUF2243 domain-containing protein n=1 Tax=Micromonospora sp. CPCC 205539 TaxID=3122408 RepID=UPI002FEF97B9